METPSLSPFLVFILIIFGVLQIILFFKVWGMTNNTKEIRDMLWRAEKRKIIENKPLYGWAEDVTEDEILYAYDLARKIKDNSIVVVKYRSTNEFKTMSREVFNTYGEKYNKLIFDKDLASIL